MILAIDLSLKSTGYAKFSTAGKFIEKGQIVPEKDLDSLFKINLINNRLIKLMEESDELVIEDLFFGKNFSGIRELARLSGAVINSWIDKKEKLPHIYMASTARKLVGIKGNSQKIEIQVWVANKYKFCNEETLELYESHILELRTMLLAETSVVSNLPQAIQKSEVKKARGRYKRNMMKLSTKFEKEAGVGNDFADAIVLALAFLEATK